MPIRRAPTARPTFQIGRNTPSASAHIEAAVHLARTAIDSVDGFEKLRFRDEREIVIGVQVRRGACQGDRVAAVFEHDRAEAPRLNLGQFPGHLGTDLIDVQLDERQIELRGERRGHAVFRNVPLIHQNAAEAPYAPELAPSACCSSRARASCSGLSTP